VLRVFVFFVVFLLVGCEKVEVQSRFFDVSSQAVVDLADLSSDGWVLVNYWAQWCTPCLKEVPELNRLNARDDVLVVGVYHGDVDVGQLAVFSRAFGIGYVSVGQDVAPFFGFVRDDQFVPMSYLVHLVSREVVPFYGPQSYESFVRYLEENVNESQSSMARSD